MKRLVFFAALISLAFTPGAALSAAQDPWDDDDIDFEYPCYPTSFSVDGQCHECAISNVTLLLWEPGVCSGYPDWAIFPCLVRVGVTFTGASGGSGPCSVSVMMGDSAECGESGGDISGCPTGPGNALMTMSCQACNE